MPVPHVGISNGRRKWYRMPSPYYQHLPALNIQSSQYVVVVAYHKGDIEHYWDGGFQFFRMGRDNEYFVEQDVTAGCLSA